MANALGALFSDIANAIRGKTGNEGTMKPAEFPAAIDGIVMKADPVLAELTVSENGLYVPGEGVDGFNSVTVNVADSGTDTEEIDDLLDEINGEFIGETQYKFTFIGASGEILCEVPVYDTQDCPDPITAGIISKPTKESTPQYRYAYSHWSPTEGGSADSSIFQNVTEDRTVYAVFTSTVRSYTIRYYDGETLKKSVTYKYGATPTAYTLEKQGYSFEGWEPEVTTVTGDVDCYAQWSEKPSFAGSTWTDIAEISARREAANTFYAGDRKTILVGNQYTDGYEEAEVEICNFDDDGRMTIGFVDVIKLYGAAGFSGSDYASSTFASTIDASLVNVMPDELKNVLIEHTRLYTNLYSEKQFEHTAKFFLPSITEINGAANRLGLYDGVQFQHYTKCKSEAYQTRTWRNSGDLYTIQPDGSLSYNDTFAYYAPIFKV